MGLDTSHDCWHGGYGSFMRWRCQIAKAAGLPPLQWMDGFYRFTDISLEDASTTIKAIKPGFENAWARDLLSAFYFGGNMPLKWESLKPSPLHALLNHSDCDGEIPSEQCAVIADALEEVLPNLPDEDAGGHVGNWREKTQTFIDGLRDAAEKGEAVDFH